DRTLRRRQSQESHQTDARRSSRPELRRSHRSPRHSRAQHHARAGSTQAPLYPVLHPNPTPGGRLPPTRPRPRSCPVAEKPDNSFDESDQTLAQLTNENFGLTYAPLNHLFIPWNQDKG